MDNWITIPYLLKWFYYIVYTSLVNMQKWKLFQFIPPHLCFTIRLNALIGWYELMHHQVELSQAIVTIKDLPVADPTWYTAIIPVLYIGPFLNLYFHCHRTGGGFAIWRTLDRKFLVVEMLCLWLTRSNCRLCFILMLLYCN